MMPNISVLIIEDEENYRLFLKKVVEKRYECETASNGIEAKEKIRHGKYDIIIHDLRLPGIKGRDLIHYVRNYVDQDIVNIIITGYENDWPPIDSKEEDVFYYLKKGEFKPDDLLKILENAAKIRENRLSEKKHLFNIIKQEKKSFLTKLAISIAHEINNPLQSMMLATHMIKRNFSRKITGYRDELDEELKILEKSIQRIKKTIELLIDFNRKNPSEGKILSIDRILNTTLSFLRPIAKERGIKINNPELNGYTSHPMVKDSYVFALLYFFLEYVEFPIKDISFKIKDDDSKVYIIIESEIKDVHSKKIRYIKELYLSRDIFNILGGRLSMNTGNYRYTTVIEILTTKQNLKTA